MIKNKLLSKTFKHFRKFPCSVTLFYSDIFNIESLQSLETKSTWLNQKENLWKMRRHLKKFLYMGVKSNL